jgi:hypothetical protein
MQKNIAILWISIIILFTTYSCKNYNCIECEWRYSAGPYYNLNTNDTVVLTLRNEYVLDTLEKYYSIGYVKVPINGSHNLVKFEYCEKDNNYYLYSQYIDCY